MRDSIMGIQNHALNRVMGTTKDERTASLSGSASGTARIPVSGFATSALVRLPLAPSGDDPRGKVERGSVLLEARAAHVRRADAAGGSRVGKGALTLAFASIAVSARARPLIAIEGRAEALPDAFD